MASEVSATFTKLHTIGKLADNTTIVKMACTLHCVSFLLNTVGSLPKGKLWGQRGWWNEPKMTTTDCNCAGIPWDSNVNLFPTCTMHGYGRQCTTNLQWWNAKAFTDVIQIPQAGPDVFTWKSNHHAKRLDLSPMANTKYVVYQRPLYKLYRENKIACTLLS